MKGLEPGARVRRLVLDISPLMTGYLLFQAVLGLFLDFIWVRHPFGNPMLLPGVLLALNGSMIAPKVPLWRTLPVTARDIDRARWWHSVGVPASVMALLLAVAVLILKLAGHSHAGWRDIALSWGGQLACCVTTALVWMAMPLARRKWGSWSGLALVPLLLLYFRIVVPAHGDLRPSLAYIIPAAILAAALLYLTAGRWPLPQTTAMWASPSGEGAGEGAPSRLSGWPVLIRANLPVWLWLWGMMVFISLTLKWILPDFDLNLFGWIFGLMSAQFAVTNLATAMRSLRALPLRAARLTLVLVLLLLSVQGLSLILFRLVLAAGGEQAMPVAAFLAPLVFPLLYFPAALRFGLRVAQIGYALSIIVIAPLQLLSRDAATAPPAVAGLCAIAALGIFWTWREIARGSRAYRMQPLVPARWRGA